MNRTMMLLAASLFAISACDKPAETKPEDPASKNATTTGATTTAAVATPTPTPTPLTIADTDLSTPTDFEESAEKAITKTTYKAELSALETDLAKE